MPPGLGIVLMDFILFVGWDLVVFEQINFPGGHFGQISGFLMLPNPYWSLDFDENFQNSRKSNSSKNFLAALEAILSACHPV